MTKLNDIKCKEGLGWDRVNMVQNVNIGILFLTNVKRRPAIHIGAF